METKVVKLYELLQQRRLQTTTHILVNTGSSTLQRWLYLPSLEVTAASCQEVVVGMPVQTKNGGAKRLLDVLAYPPTHR